MENKEYKDSSFLLHIYKKYWKNIPRVRKFFIAYLLIIFLGGCILWLPISQKINPDNGNIGFIDSFFVAASAVSDTGLSTVGIQESFNLFGQFILLVLLELGGIGFFAIKLFVFLKIFKPRHISYTTFLDGQTELGIIKNEKKGIGIISTAVLVTIGSTIIFGLIFGILFYLISPAPAPLQVSTVVDPGLTGHWWRAWWTGIFHAGASINNSGLDIFKGDTSFAAYYGNYFVQSLTILLFIIGGIGFAIIYDLYYYFKHLKTKESFRFSLFTKVAAITYFIVAFSGLLLVFLAESINLLTLETGESFFTNPEYGSWFDKTFAVIFNTFSTRNAGFSTLDISVFSSGTQLIFIVMMFIGSGPGSTAGGLRTTTFAVLYLSLFATIRGRESTTVFNRKFSSKSVKMAHTIFFFAILLICFSTFVISTAEIKNDQIRIIDAVFLSTSAFGTTGLATVSLATLTAYSKIMLILVMLLGKLGMSSVLSQLASKKPKKNIFIKEEINFG